MIQQLATTMPNTEFDSFLMPVMNAIAAFRAVAALGSVSDAAEKLGTSQSSLSRHVQNLEAHLNCKLFLRQKRRMILTPAGQQLFIVVDTGLGHISRKAQDLRKEQGTNEISIRCGHGFAHFWMLKHYPRLQRSYPHLQINLSVGPLGVAQLETPADFEIRLGPEANPNWHSDLLIPEDICLAASPEFLEKRGLSGQALSVPELAELPLLHLDQGEYGIHWFGSYFAEFGVNYRPDPGTLFFNSYPHVVQAATEGRGVCLLWRRLDGGALADGDLVELPGTVLKGNGGYYLTCRNPSKDEPGFSNVRRWMINACSMTLKKPV